MALPSLSPSPFQLGLYEDKNFAPAELPITILSSFNALKSYFYIKGNNKSELPPCIFITSAHLHSSIKFSCVAILLSKSI